MRGDQTKQYGIFSNTIAWVSAVFMLLFFMLWAVWGLLFDMGRGVSNDRRLGFVPRILDRLGALRS